MGSFLRLCRKRTHRTLRYVRGKRLSTRPVCYSEGAVGTVSMITTNYGRVSTFAIMLKDWLGFVGRRPEEIVVVDGGTGPESLAMYTELFKQKLIDKLYVMQPEHPENTRHTCFIQEYYSGVMASGDYLLFFKTDTIPFRKGHENWLDEYISILAGTPRLFAMTGSSPGPSFLGQASDEFWCLEHTSENFALIPRHHHVAAMQICADFWKSGWRGINPFASVGETAERCLIESAWDRYCRKQGMHCLMQKEDSSWSVFHTCADGSELLGLCQKTKVRDELTPFYNRSGLMLGVDSPLS